MKKVIQLQQEVSLLKRAIDKLEWIQTHIKDEVPPNRKSLYSILFNLKMVLGCFEQIPSVKKVYKEFIWSDLNGLRSVLIHRYYPETHNDLTLILWKTCKQVLPSLGHSLKRMEQEIQTQLKGVKNQDWFELSPGTKLISPELNPIRKLVYNTPIRDAINQDNYIECFKGQLEIFCELAGVDLKLLTLETIGNSVEKIASDRTLLDTESIYAMQNCLEIIRVIRQGRVGETGTWKEFNSGLEAALKADRTGNIKQAHLHLFELSKVGRKATHESMELKLDELAPYLYLSAFLKEPNIRSALEVKKGIEQTTTTSVITENVITKSTVLSTTEISSSTVETSLLAESTSSSSMKTSEKGKRKKEEEEYTQPLKYQRSALAEESKPDIIEGVEGGKNEKTETRPQL